MLRYVYRWCVINVSSSTSKISERGSCFHVCPVFSASAVWSWRLLIRKFKPGGIIFNSICFSTRSFDTFIVDVWSMFTVSFQSFLTREVAFRYVSLLDPLTRSWSMCEQCLQSHFEVFRQGKLLLGMSRVSCHRSMVTGFGWKCLQSNHYRTCCAKVISHLRFVRLLSAVWSMF